MTAMNDRPRVAAWSLALVIAACRAAGGAGDGDDISVGVTTAGGATTVPSGGTLVLKADVQNAGNPTDSIQNVVYVVSPTLFLMMNETTWHPVVQLFER
jgi:hypothetical protein